jgi:hypothetical protein
MLMIREVAAVDGVPPEFSLETLAAVVTPAAVVAAVDACGVREQRVRKLPAATTVFFCIAMNLYTSTCLGQVFAHLVSGVRWLWPRPDAWQVSAGALCHARARLGARPLVALFKRVCRPLATRATSDRPATPGAFFGKWRLMALDGTKWNVPDTPANARAFGRPASSRGTSAWPQIQVVALGECGTHALCDAGVWRCDASEHAAARRLLRSVGPDTLLTWDRGLHSFDLVVATRARRAHLLGRLSASVQPEVVHTLRDGTQLVRLRPSDSRRRRAGEQVLVRLITYTLDDPARPGHGEVHRLITSLLNPRVAPAAALVEAYHARWEEELAFDELETHQRPPRPLRSQTPVGVIQEVYGLLLAHYVIRAVMVAAAAAAPTPLAPTSVSFLTAVRLIRLALPECHRTTPADQPRLYRQLLADIAARPLPPRRNRSNPRVVKQKMSNFRVKTPGHRRWPQPTKAFRDAIVLAK